MANDMRQFTALTSGTGLVEFTGWAAIEVTGEDRSTFLNNFCTNDISQLTPGAGCEAFLTDSHGHVLTHAWVFCEAHALVLVAAAPPAAEILAHLDRYIFRAPVQLRDRSDQWPTLLVAGATAGETLRAATHCSLPQSNLAHSQAELAGFAVSLRRTDLAGPMGYLVQCPSAAGAAAVAVSLVDGGATRCAQSCFEQVRVEAGTPLYGPDISKANLPQEVGRNARAISFSKGCYLGQETVARIASRGHVNRVLVGVRFQGNTIPPAGSELTADNKLVGQITSSVYSPRLDCPLALAYVRTSHASVATQLEWRGGQAAVVTLPVTG